ncbi:MAG: type II secretion system F family protein [Actinomycetaceae bacterium]|nr:type II secretion system F family protein [Actinomycetaceae bacterium]
MIYLSLCSLGLGAVCLWAYYCAGVPTLVRRIRPYVGESGVRATSPFPTVASLARDLALAILTRCGSTSAAIARRQRLAGRPVDVHALRLDQVTWAATGAAVGCALAGSAAASGTLPLGGGLLLLAFCALAGALSRDWWLTRAARVRQDELARQLPDVAELLALAVGAGESVADALERVSRVSDAPMGEEMARVHRLTRAGTSLSTALVTLARDNDCAGLTRLCDATRMAIARGTPLAAVLRDQAADERERSRRDLMESAGRKEIAMLVPVVFLIMPITVVFALYPGLITLSFGF